MEIYPGNFLGVWLQYICCWELYGHMMLYLFVL